MLNKIVTTNQKEAEWHNRWDKMNDRMEVGLTIRVTKYDFSDSPLGI